MTKECLVTQKARAHQGMIVKSGQIWGQKSALSWATYNIQAALLVVQV